MWTDDKRSFICSWYFDFLFFQTIFIGKFFLDAAKECQTVIPLTEQATKIYRQICSNGLNKKDFSVVYKYIHDLKT